MTESNLNKFSSKHIEYHILQSFPVTCLNRDDVGSPKTAIVGGVQRARVSSQCWKRQVRLQLHELGVKLAIRTKRVEELITEKCKKLGVNEEKAKAWGQACAENLAKDTLFFISDAEIEQIARLGMASATIVAGSKSDDAEKGKGKKDAKEKNALKELSTILNKCKKSSLDGLDLALFGRMVANDSSMNIEAAASFAHAISIHKVNSEIDFFTALDDLEDKQGSAHMGMLEYNSATYYRYISLDLGQLYINLGESEDDVYKAVETFTKALYLAIPEARQNTQSGSCLWDYARILVRKGQRLQIPFDAPVKPNDGYLKPGIKAMDEYLENKKKQAGTLFQEIAEVTFGEGTDLSIDGVIDQLKKAIEVKA